MPYSILYEKNNPHKPTYSLEIISKVLTVNSLPKLSTAFSVPVIIKTPLIFTPFAKSSLRLPLAVILIALSPRFSPEL
jgi:hypothetical protein